MIIGTPFNLSLKIDNKSNDSNSNGQKIDSDKLLVIIAAVSFIVLVIFVDTLDIHYRKDKNGVELNAYFDKIELI